MEIDLSMYHSPKKEHKYLFLEGHNFIDYGLYLFVLEQNEYNNVIEWDKYMLLINEYQQRNSELSSLFLDKSCQSKTLVLVEAEKNGKKGE